MAEAITAANAADVGIQLHCSGVEELSQWFEHLPERCAKSALARALAAAAVEIVADVADRTPESDDDDRDETVTHLVDSIRTQIDIDGDGRGGKASVGFGKRGYLAVWLEYGWRLTGHKPNKKFIKDVPEHGDIYLTGSKRHFMRDAIEAASDKALEAFTKSFSNSLDEYKSELRPPPEAPK